jgi:murein DD-endopeptidase MepM/ murein hydrolase activator NlpD
VFLAGSRRAALSYYVGGNTPSEVRIDLVRDGDTAPVASWTPGTVAPGTVQSLEWDGTVAGGAAPPEGRYEFRVSAPGAAQAPAATAPRAAQAGAGATSGFLLLAHAFPVHGAHQIGLEPAQRFGAVRDGHTHQGQDVFAACGTPLVAVRGGVVRFKATQAAAGNYVVIRADGEGADYAYMHLREPALVEKGVRVATGQLIGFVGDTGDADGCHLHFEKWPAPGWYTGGAPVDPLPDLQSWDRTS